MDAIYQSDNGVFFRRNLLALAGLALPGLAALAAAVLIPASTGAAPAWVPFMSIAICGSWIGTIIAASMNVWPRERRGALRIDSEGIVLDGDTVARADEIIGASFAKSGWRDPVVRLRLRGRRLPRYLRVRDEADGKAVLAALQLDAAHTRASFALPWGPFRWGVWIVFYMSIWVAAPFVCILGVLLSRGRGELSPAGYSVMGLVSFGLITGYWLLFWRSRQLVTVGADGILLSQWGRTRFIGYGQILGLHPRPGPEVKGMRAASEAFDLELRSGERIGFYTERVRRRLGLLEGDVVMQRIREAMSVGAQLGHGGEPHLHLSTRLSDLRRLGGVANVDMRTAPADVDGLWRLIEDPSAPPGDRAAAAAALSASPEPTTRERLRAAAEATAMPKLRAAIEAAANGEDDELEAALEEMREEAQER